MTAENAGLARESRFPAPPMLWAWALFFLLFAVPDIPDLWDGARAALDAGRQTSDSVLWYPIASIEILLIVAITVGLVLAAIPHLRRWYVHRAFQLESIESGPASLDEIRAFLRQEIPDAILTMNLRRTRSLVFVYPEGWRTPGFAIFAGLLRLWRLDRPQAEAILMHEIEHARQRDFVLAGVGSPLRAVLRYTVPAYVLLFVIPTFVLALRESLNSYRAMQEIASISDASFDLGEFLRYQADNFTQIWLVGWITQGFSTLALVLAVLVVPVAALWTMELNADRAASAHRAARRRISESLNSISAGDQGSSVRPLRYFVHPPDALRLWMLRRGAFPSLATLLLILPFSYLLALALLHTGAFINWSQVSLMESVLTGDSTWSSVRTAVGYHSENFWTYTRSWLTDHPSRWALLGLVIATWPLSASSWRAAQGDSRALPAPPEQGISLIVGGTILGVAALAFLLA